MGRRETLSDNLMATRGTVVESHLQVATKPALGSHMIGAREARGTLSSLHYYYYYYYSVRWSPSNT